MKIWRNSGGGVRRGHLRRRHWIVSSEDKKYSDWMLGFRPETTIRARQRAPVFHKFTILHLKGEEKPRNFSMYSWISIDLKPWVLSGEFLTEVCDLPHRLVAVSMMFLFSPLPLPQSSFTHFILCSCHWTRALATHKKCVTILKCGARSPLTLWQIAVSYILIYQNHIS